MAAETARLLALAFDPDVRTADDASSRRILDARSSWRPPPGSSTSPWMTLPSAPVWDG